MLSIIFVSTLLFKVLGVKNVVWSRGKAWGVHGRRFLLRFSKLGSNPNFIECMQFIDNSFMIMQIVLSARKKREEKREEKKTIKKLVQTFSSN